MISPPSSDTSLPIWVNDIQQSPIFFAQVREDAIIDKLLVQDLQNEAKILMIASGGCTTALLSTLPNVSSIECVDLSDAQIALCQLKLYLLEHADTPERLKLLGHVAHSADYRADFLPGIFEKLQLDREIFGDLKQVIEKGPDYVGRYEQLFEQMQCTFAPYQDKINHLLSLNNIDQQKHYIEVQKLSPILEAAINDAFALPVLIALFSEEATQNQNMPFDKHFIHQTQKVIFEQTLRDNPFISQFLSNTYQDDCYADWFNLPKQKPHARIQFSRSTMMDKLRNSNEQYDFIHLSNILDWLSKEEASTLLELASARCRKNGTVIIRQLNSNLEIAKLSDGFDWQHDLEDKLIRQDRSFFYRKLLIGKKS